MYLLMDLYVLSVCRTPQKVVFLLQRALLTLTQTFFEPSVYAILRNNVWNTLSC